MPTQHTTTCPTCGGETYRCLAESFGTTGSHRSTVQYRHEATGRIACPVEMPAR